MHLSKTIHPRQKVLSVFSLVMINVIAVDSLRSLAISASYGASLIFYYALGAIIFFIPIAITAAELATGWPRIGGLYVWVREAFGQRWALFTIWMQWIYNIVWFPTILSFIAATLAYLIEPQLANSKAYMLGVVLTLFWGATLANCFGMKISSLISTIGAIIGTILPMLLIIGLGSLWLLKGNASHIDFSIPSMTPDLSSINNLAFFIAVLFSLLGVEMSAVHAEDVKNPRRDYPRALLYSAIIILFTLTASSLAIAIVIPREQISLVSGLIDAFGIFFATFNLPWMIPIIVAMIILGSLGGVSAWIIGPCKGLLAAAEDGCLPAIFQYTSEKGSPIVILLLQAIIFTVLCSIFLFAPTINSSYWILSALTAQLAMLVYVFMFAAVIRLRYSQPEVKRAYRIPGGKPGLWLTGLIGITTSVFAIIIGFFPPPEIAVTNLLSYELFLFGGLIIFSILPLWLYAYEKKNQSRRKSASE